MYSSHLNFIFSSVCFIFYMLLVTSKYGITVATVLQEQFGTCNDHLNLQCLRLMIHVCTDHKQVQELHLKNQYALLPGISVTVLASHFKADNI